MKVAILGGGFFGCWIACKLSDLPIISEVSIYEKNDSLMNEASKNNQHRFHLGYHYPRCQKTVSQILEVKSFFDREFEDCTFEIDENLYLISKNGSLTSAAEFSNVFSSHLINEIDLEDYASEIHVNRIERGFKVHEKGLSNSLIKKKILREMLLKDKLKVFVNHEVSELEQIDYDIVVNCTYTGVNLTSSMKVKYELCVLALVNYEANLNRAYTIMDGKFPSLYPTGTPGISTLSHVEKTPIYRTTSLDDLITFRNNLNVSDLQKANSDIIEASSEFFKLKFQPVGQYLSYKAKLLEDSNDVRTSEVIYDNEKITLLQGKITTISSISDEVVAYAKNYIDRQGFRS